MLRPSSYLGGHPNNNCHHVLSAYLVKTLLSPLSSLEGGASIILEKEAQRNEEICPRSHCWDFVVELGSGAGNWASESKLLSTRLPEEVHTPGAVYKCSPQHCWEHQKVWTITLPLQRGMGGSIRELLLFRSQKEWTGSMNIKMD